MGEALHRWLNPEVLEHAGALGDSFQTAQPFRHVAIDNFFSAERLQRLVDTFPPFDEALAINENGVVGAKCVNEKVTELGPDWVELDELVKGEDFRQLIGHITGIPDLQYDPHYFGGGTHENRQGQGLDAHIDFNYHPITRQHRRLNLILYLTPEWDDAWGGSIQLHRDPYRPPSQDEIAVITPQMNRCVIFETNEHSWHGFPRIQLPEDKQHLSRKSFALYYYTDSRPEEETGMEHSTIYVEQHLPEDLVPGTPLDAETLQHLHQLVGSRDEHLKRLYRDIKRLTAELNQATREILSLREQMLGQPAATRELPPEPVVADADPGDLEQRLQQREAEIHRLYRALAEIKASTSWRVTAPMRGLKRLFGKG